MADATDETAAAAAVAATVETFGGLDILVANAGIEGKPSPVETQTLENFEEVLRTNVIGVWLAMKYGVKAMKENGGGSIIALSSVAGVIGFPEASQYVASKHAVYGLVKTAAIEQGESGIRINAIGPGPIDNRLMENVAVQRAPDNVDEWQAGIEQMVPMKRYGTNEEVANVALFLASDESSYCTGGMYLVDGGFTARSRSSIHVRFGSGTDISRSGIYVRFTPNNGHRKSVCMVLAVKRILFTGFAHGKR